MIYKCLDGCCTIDIVSYSGINKSKFTEKKKAGVFLYDPDNDRVLIVQNKGMITDSSDTHQESIPYCGTFAFKLLAKLNTH